MIQNDLINTSTSQAQDEVIALAEQVIKSNWENRALSDGKYAEPLVFFTPCEVGEPSHISPSRSNLVVADKFLIADVCERLKASGFYIWYEQDASRQEWFSVTALNMPPSKFFHRWTHIPTTK